MGATTTLLALSGGRRSMFTPLRLLPCKAALNVTLEKAFAAVEEDSNNVHREEIGNFIADIALYLIREDAVVQARTEVALADDDANAANDDADPVEERRASSKRAAA